MLQMNNMSPEMMFFISSMLWGMGIGIILGWPDKSRAFIISIPPKKAPPPEAFEKDYD